MEPRHGAVFLGLLVLLAGMGTGFDDSTGTGDGDLNVSYNGSTACDLDCTVELKVESDYNGALLGYNVSIGFNDIQSVTANLTVNGTNLGTTDQPLWDATTTLSGWNSSTTSTWFVNLTLSNVTPVSTLTINQSFRWNDSIAYSASTVNETTVTTNVTLQNEAPRIDVDLEGDDSYINRTSYLNATITDANPLRYGNATINGRNITNGTGSTEVAVSDGTINETLNVSHFSDGAYEGKISATDALGKGGSSDFSLVIDTTPPEVWNLTVNATGNSSDPYSGTLNLTGTVNETFYSSGKATCDITLDADRDMARAGFNVSGSGESHWFNATLPADGLEGSTTLSVSCTDPAGNTGTNTSFYTGGTTSGNLTSSIWLDNRVPDVESVSPANGSYVTSEDQTISATVSDLSGFNTNYSTASLNFNGTVFTNSSSNLTVTYSGTTADISLTTYSLTENYTYEASLRINDSLNQTQVHNWTFSTDYTPPSFNMSGILNADGQNETVDGWYEDGAHFITRCTDSISGVENRTVAADGNTLAWNATSGRNATVMYEPESYEGDRTYTITCTDIAGNSASADRDLKIDAKNPVLTEVTGDGSFEAGSFPAETSITFTFDDGGIGFNATPYKNDPEEFSSDFDSISFEENEAGNEIVVDGTYKFTEADDRTFDYAIEDIFGHSISGEVMIDATKSDSTGTQGGSSQSGGGGTGGLPQTLSSYDLSLSGVPDELQIDPGGHVERTFTVENTGDGGTVDFSVTAPDGLTIADVGPVFLQSGSSIERTLVFNASDDFSGGDVELTASIGEISVSRTITVQPADDPAALGIEVSNDSLSLEQGSQQNLTVTVSNTGDQEAVGVSVVLNRSRLAATAFTPTNTTIAGGDTERFTGAIGTSGLDIGVHDIVITATARSTSATHTISLKVQPSSEEEAAAVRSRIAALEEQAQAANVSSQVLQTLEQAQQAARSGDYARAAELADQVDEEVPEPGLTDQLPLPSLRTVGTAIGVIALLGVLGVGAMLYRDSGGYRGGSGPGRYLDGESKSMSQRLKDGKRRVSYGVKEKLEGQEPGQKRVRFDDED